MRLRVVLVLLLVPAASFAATCGIATLAAYTAGSCDYFGVTFGSWTYAMGATGVPATDIMVIPSVVTPVFEFLDIGPAPWASAGAPVTFSIAFTATGAGAAVGSQILLGAPSGSGSMSGLMNECLGGLLPACSPGTPTALAVTLGSPFASNSFGSFSTIDVGIAVTLTGDMATRTVTAGLGVPVPEPSSFALLGGGLLGTLGYRRLRRRGRNHRKWRS